MFFVPLVEKLHVFGPAGLEIVQNVIVFVKKLMVWDGRLRNCPKCYCFCPKLDVVGPAG